MVPHSAAEDHRRQSEEDEKKRRKDEREKHGEKKRKGKRRRDDAFASVSVDSKINVRAEEAATWGIPSFSNASDEKKMRKEEGNPSVSMRDVAADELEKLREKKKKKKRRKDDSTVYVNFFSDSGMDPTGGEASTEEVKYSRNASYRTNNSKKVKKNKPSIIPRDAAVDAQEEMPSFSNASDQNNKRTGQEKKRKKSLMLGTDAAGDELEKQEEKEDKKKRRKDNFAILENLDLEKNKDVEEAAMKETQTSSDATSEKNRKKEKKKSSISRREGTADTAVPTESGKKSRTVSFSQEVKVIPHAAPTASTAAAGWCKENGSRPRKMN